jgi:hypothetical protein
MSRAEMRWPKPHMKDVGLDMVLQPRVDSHINPLCTTLRFCAACIASDHDASAASKIGSAPGS